MDHFSREGDELSRAMDKGTLLQNFQGYSTHSGADLYGFGMSGISNVGQYYWQNTNDLGAYYQPLEAGKSPVFKILSLSRDDLIRKNVIIRLMCRMGIDFSRISDKWDIRFTDYFANALSKLGPFEQDGLIVSASDHLQITEKGRLFLRNIAMCFDRYLEPSKTEHKFSKTV